MNRIPNEVSVAINPAEHIANLGAQLQQNIDDVMFGRLVGDSVEASRAKTYETLHELNHAQGRGTYRSNFQRGRLSVELNRQLGPDDYRSGMAHYTSAAQQALADGSAEAADSQLGRAEICLKQIGNSEGWSQRKINRQTKKLAKEVGIASRPNVGQRTHATTTLIGAMALGAVGEVLQNHHAEDDAASSETREPENHRRRKVLAGAIGAVSFLALGAAAYANSKGHYVDLSLYHLPDAAAADTAGNIAAQKAQSAARAATAAHQALLTEAHNLATLNAHAPEAHQVPELSSPFQAGHQLPHHTAHASQPSSGVAHHLPHRGAPEAQPLQASFEHLDHRGDTIWTHVQHHLGKHGPETRVRKFVDRILASNHLTYFRARFLPVGFRFKMPS